MPLDSILDNILVNTAYSYKFLINNILYLPYIAEKSIHIVDIVYKY